MKVFIYTSKQNVPFNNLYDRFAPKKFFLSNKEKEVQNFNSNNGEQIKYLLPANIKDNNDGCIFFIPLDMKDSFLNLLKIIFKDANWLEKQTTEKPSNEQLGIIGGDQFSNFYSENTKIQSTIEYEVMRKEQQELVQLFDRIAEHKNGIDAVLVCNHDDMLFSSTPKQGSEYVDTDSFVVQIDHFIKMLEMTDKVNTHLKQINKAELLYEGGIVKIIHMPMYHKHTFLVFVGTQPDELKIMNYHINAHLDEIYVLLDKLLKTA